PQAPRQGAIARVDAHRAKVAVTSPRAGEDRVVHDLDVVRQPLRALTADDEADARPVAGHARVGADEDVVHDPHVVGRAGDVELGAAALVDPEAVVLDPQALTCEELDQVLVLAPDTADPARQSAREAVAPDRQGGAEATMDEVAAVAV